MTTVRASERRKRGRDTGIGTGDRGVAARVAGALRSAGNAKAGGAVLVVASGQRLELPQPLADVMAHAASLFAEGRKVSVVADDEMLTTQAAADLLNVSRQYVVRLVDQGELPAVKVGSHRRVRVKDVEAYRIRREADRDAALDRLAGISEEMDGYRLAR